MNSTRRNEQGITAIFIVVFAALLLSIITIAFITIMIREQRRATDNEQSQSAYDSALAGVEDAKRAVIVCNRSATPPPECAQMNGTDCNVIGAVGVTGVTNGETMIETSTGDGRELNQAYTCVTILRDSPDFVTDILQPDGLMAIPLRAVGAFDSVRVEWQMLEDDTTVVIGSIPSSDPCAASPPNVALYPLANWGACPALLRSQFIVPASASVTPTELDQAANGNTVFYYPTTEAGAALTPHNVLLANQGRYAPTSGSVGVVPNEPALAFCSQINMVTTGYACTSSTLLAAPVPGGSDVAMLVLSPLYKSASARITLFNGASQVSFSGVQPVVDSTGRANDLYRRIEARLSLTDTTNYPDAAISLQGSLCKNYWVTNTASGAMTSPVSCDP